MGFGGIVGDVIRAQGADKAGKAQASGFSDAAELLEDFLAQNRADQQPFREAGQRAITLLEQLVTGRSPDVKVANPEFAKIQKLLQNTPAVLKENVANREGDFRGEFTSVPNDEFNKLSSKLARTSPTLTIPGTEEVDRTELLRSSPGFQFRLDEGVEARDRSASARGLLLSGAQQRGLEEFGQNFASNEFSNLTNELARIAGIGQNITVAGGNQGVQGSAIQGGFLGNEGTARASGIAGKAAGLASASDNFFEGLFGAFGFGGGGGLGGGA